MAKVFTDNDYREGFKEYLESLKEYERVDMEFLDETLMPIIREYFDSEFVGIFAVRDTNFYESVLSALRRNPETKDLINGEDDRRYSRALKLLQAYYGSKYLPVRKLKSNPRVKKNLVAVIETHPSPEPQSDTEASTTHTEGARKEMAMERAYRNRDARNECIRIWGAQCQVCGMRFKDYYGDMPGEEFIEVHHLIPISTRDTEYQIDPTQELVPLCSNCHSMIHRGTNGPMSLDELRNIYKGPFTPIDKLMML